MWRKTASFIVGPLVWLLSYGVMILIMTIFWRLSPDNYLSMGISVFISASVATYLAIATMEKLNTSINIPKQKSYFIIAIFVLFWIGSAVVSEIALNREGELIYKLIALILSQAGVVLGWGIRMEHQN